MTPDETSSGESRFRERRSAFADDEVTSEAGGEKPSSAEPAPGGGEAEPIIETPPGAIREAPAEPGPAADETPVRPETGEPKSPAGDVDLDRLDRVEIPEPSFLEIVQPLEIQALQFLGEVPLTESGERRVLPRWAKHVIDLLGLLEERTRGNLPEDERRYLEQVLTELRTRYLRVTS